jgi:hypothetical protein
LFFFLVTLSVAEGRELIDLTPTLSYKEREIMRKAF